MNCPKNRKTLIDVISQRIVLSFSQGATVVLPELISITGRTVVSFLRIKAFDRIRGNHLLPSRHPTEDGKSP